MLLRQAGDVVVHKRGEAGQCLLSGAVLAGECLIGLPAEMGFQAQLEAVAGVKISQGQPGLGRAQGQEPYQQQAALAVACHHGVDQPAGESGGQYAGPAEQEAHNQGPEEPPGLGAENLEEFFHVCSPQGKIWRYPK